MKDQEIASDNKEKSKNAFYTHTKHQHHQQQQQKTRTVLKLSIIQFAIIQIQTGIWVRYQTGKWCDKKKIIYSSNWKKNERLHKLKLN